MSGNSDIFNWAFIGAGGIARSVAKRVMRGESHRLAAVFNRTRQRAEELARNYGAEVFLSPEAAANSEAVDGVYINVTNNVHFEMAKRVLKGGKPVLLEKPFTTNAEQSKELFAIARENNVYLAEAMWTWFAPPANRLKKVMDGGSLGKVKSALVTLCLPIAFGKNSRLLKSSLAGGALLDVGVYPITYAYRLFGRPKALQCRAKFKCDVDVTDEFILRYDGFDVTVKTSVRSFCGVGERLRIECENGKISAGNYHSGAGFTVTDKDGTHKYPGVKNAMAEQFDNVAAEIREGRKQSAFVPPEATIAVMELLDEIRRKINLKFSFEK